MSSCGAACENANLPEPSGPPISCSRTDDQGSPRVASSAAASVPQPMETHDTQPDTVGQHRQLWGSDAEDSKAAPEGAVVDHWSGWEQRQQQQIAAESHEYEPQAAPPSTALEWSPQPWVSHATTTPEDVNAVMDQWSGWEQRLEQQIAAESHEYEPQAATTTALEWSPQPWGSHAATTPEDVNAVVDHWSGWEQRQQQQIAAESHEYEPQQATTTTALEVSRWAWGSDAATTPEEVNAVVDQWSGWEQRQQQQIAAESHEYEPQATTTTALEVSQWAWGSDAATSGPTAPEDINVVMDQGPGWEKRQQQQTEAQPSLVCVQP
eukprot:817088-Amphidinium_carterae.2